MAIVPIAPTGVDVTPSDDATWTVAIIRIDVRRVDTAMRANPFWSIDRRATAAIIGTDRFGGEHVLATNVMTAASLVALARTLALADGAELVEPPACEYCGLPVAAGLRYCPGTNCWLADAGREVTWWAA